MAYEFVDIYESIKKADVKSIEKKIDSEILDLINNKEFQFLSPYLKQKGKPLYDLLTAYIKKIGGGSKAKNDANIMMLAPILTAMEAEIKK